MQWDTNMNMFIVMKEPSEGTWLSNNISKSQLGTEITGRHSKIYMEQDNIYIYIPSRCHIIDVEKDFITFICLFCNRKTFVIAYSKVFYQRHIERVVCRFSDLGWACIDMKVNLCNVNGYFDETLRLRALYSINDLEFLQNLDSLSSTFFFTRPIRKFQMAAKCS